MNYTKIKLGPICFTVYNDLQLLSHRPHSILPGKMLLFLKYEDINGQLQSDLSKIT